MYNGPWEMKCTKKLDVFLYSFVPGTVYHIKDKFIGDDGTIESGVWEVKDGRGTLHNITREQRDNYFEV